LCLQMEVPPQSLQMLLWWLCSQMRDDVVYWYLIQ
jgi:hypothetical protein